MCSVDCVPVASYYADLEENILFFLEEEEKSSSRGSKEENPKTSKHDINFKVSPSLLLWSFTYSQSVDLTEVMPQV